MASVSIILQKTPIHISVLRALSGSQKTLYSLPGAKGQESKLPHLKSQICLYSSDTDRERIARVLNHSTLLVQDGIDIEELPILIKRVTLNSFPFSSASSHTYSGDTFHNESDFNTTFEQDLRNCSTVNDIFKLLEVPSEKVRGVSASLALKRLHILKYLSMDWHQIHSFIRSAVMRELYNTVEQDVKHLPNNILISLVGCYLTAEGFSPVCIDAINFEIQSRLGDEVFSIEELLSLVNVLKMSKDTGMKHPSFNMGIKYPSLSVVSENSSRLLSNDDGEELQMKMQQFDKYSSKINPEIREEIRLKCLEIANNVWIHLISRYQDVNEHTLPLILQSVTAGKIQIINLLDRPLAKCWTSLSAEDVGSSLDNLLRLRVCNDGIMKYLGQWAYVNIHQMTPPLLLSFLNTFIHFNFLDENIVKVMERCLSLNGPLVQIDVVAMCVEYCRSCRYLSPLVMDAAASHFTQYADSYEPLHLYVVLRAFGQLNYLPPKSSAFLKKVESCLMERFDYLHEAELVEILGSFTFIGVIPKNFYSSVSSPEFRAKIHNSTRSGNNNPRDWLRLLKHAIIINEVQDVDKQMEWILGGKNIHMLFYQDNNSPAVSCVIVTLKYLLGDQYYHVLPFYACCAIYLDSDGLPLQVTKDDVGCTKIHGQITKKLVILLRSADQFTVNTRQLLGVHAQRLKYLTDLGFVPIEVATSNLMYLQRQSGTEAADLISYCLTPYINFNKLAETRVKDNLKHDRAFLNRMSHNFTPSTRKIKKLISVEDSGLLNSYRDVCKDRDEPN
uniref:FAST kinase leucine-rich domain-containing protein n=1 Tax=Arion vulgaris TaxID=1028688 RepID=A0A0B7A637_9EUPU